MDPLQPQSSQAAEGEAPAGSAYHWSVPGQGLSVYIDFDVIDRLGFEIMRGFGAVPRRGAEVGGILLGSAESGEHTVVRIEDFVPLACEHLRGPSFILSESDIKALDETLERWVPAPDKRIYVVGLYRSNTREVLQLAPEDLEILDSRLKAPTTVFLMVKPFATRVSEATFFLRENGRWPTGAGQQVFPFRRKELGGGKPPKRPRAGETPEPEEEAGHHPVEDAVHETAHPPMLDVMPSFAALASMPPVELDPAAADANSRSKYRSGWLWIPLSFIFLLLGVVLGFQIALSYSKQTTQAPLSDPYNLDLTVVQFGENLHLKWNPEAAAFRDAKRGMLHIQDGDNSKSVELKQEDLSRGGVLYQNASRKVRFRMEVFPRERNSISESLELRLLEELQPKTPERRNGGVGARP
jgi:hypothetical protein